MGFLEGLRLRTRYVEWIERLEEELQPAHLQGKEECVHCGACCARRPCIPTPEELERIAEFLKMDLEEMVQKYFVGDRLHGSEVEYIFPAKHTQRDITGIFLPWRRTYDEGYCIFFDESERACTIEEVKPESARATKCWEEDREDVALSPALESWRGKDITSYGILR